MFSIEEIRDQIDTILIERRVESIGLRTVHSELIKSGALTEQEKKDGIFKKLLESGKLENASLSTGSPKKWNFSLSEKGRIKLKKLIQEEEEVRKKSLRKQENKRFLKRVAYVALFIIIIVKCSQWNESDPSDFHRTVNTTTYAATSKASFDQMFNLIMAGDDMALCRMRQTGQVVILQPGEELLFVNSGLGYTVARPRGSLQSLWIVSEHLSN